MMGWGRLRTSAHGGLKRDDNHNKKTLLNGNEPREINKTKKSSPVNFHGSLAGTQINCTIPVKCICSSHRNIIVFFYAYKLTATNRMWVILNLFSFLLPVGRVIIYALQFNTSFSWFDSIFYFMRQTPNLHKHKRLIP